MPIVEPQSLDGGFRREKIVLCGPAGVGKSTAAISVAYWAHISGDKRRFWYLDFDDSAGDLLVDPKYAGMTNLEVIPVEPVWESWKAAAVKAIENVQRGDFIIGDMIDDSWRLVQSWESQLVRGQTRSEQYQEAAKRGATGWDLSKATNWQLVNAEFDEFMKPLLLSNPAHIFFTTKMKDLGAEGRGNEPENVQNARREFGRYIPDGQKHLPYQARSVLRMGRLARGRVLFTLKDRARPEYNGDDMKPDFFSMYLKGAGWTVTDPE